MNVYSTREAAKKLGIHLITLQRYLAAGTVPGPPVTKVGGVTVRLWNDTDIERARKSLPKSTNGRKTRWQRQREKQGAQAGVSQPHHAKTGRVGGPAVPQKKRKISKKK